jgi:ribonuclease P protein component
VTPGRGATPARSAAAGRDERFRPQEHIRRRAEYVAVYDRGRRVSGRLMTVFLLENGLARPRLGIAATRKFGSAVQRNRAKRFVREAFRRHKPDSWIDIVVVPKREMNEAGFGRVEAEYVAVIERRAGRPRGA